MKRLKIVKPKLKKSRSRKAYLLKRIIITNGISLLIVTATYFWMVFFLSNVGSFWDLFRPKEINVNRDVIPPTPPFLNPVPELVNQNRIDITGKAEPGVKVILYVDEAKSEETVADSEGTFTFASIQVGLFPETIYAIAVDEEENKSNKSATYTVAFDDEPAELEITNPEKAETTHKATGHSYTVTGQTEPESTVLINDRLARVTPTGQFSASIRLEEGNNEIKINVTDKAGNKTEETVYIKFEKID